MEKQPLISVIVPVYKVETYLDHCVSSILAQTYENLEVILVDDGSPDRSGQLCDAWARKDARIRVIHQENGGGGKARNTALDAATGELIAFVDSDDYIAPDLYEHLYHLLELGADIAECGYVTTEDDHASFPPDRSEPRFYTPEEAMREHIRDRVFCQVIWNKLYRREMVGPIRFPVGTRIDDEYFTYQVLGNAKKLVRSDKVCYAYRQQESSVMHRNFDLGRVLSIEAKQQRLAWIRSHMPSLENAAKVSMIESCIYFMQASLRKLKDDELHEAVLILNSAMKEIRPFPREESRLILRLAQFNLVWTARLLNILIDLHILT